MDTSAQLMVGVFSGAVGMGYLVYGKKQQRGVALFAGIGLIALPYIAPNLILALIIGIALAVLPFWLRY